VASPDLPGSMAALGVEPLEERLYRLLLEAGPLSGARLARVADLTAAEARKALKSLEAMGLIGRSAHARPLFVAVPPNLAIEGLLSQRKDELEAAREAAGNLLLEFQTLRSGTSSPEIVEVVSGSKAITQRVVQMQRSATKRFMIFDTPPYAAGDGQNLIEIEMLRRGIRYLVVYDRVALEWPGQLDLLQEIVAEGEEARLVDHLPMKLAIADGTMAMLPLSLPETRHREPERIIVHASPLLDALLALFETVWERATPVPPAARVGAITSEDSLELSDEDRKLLTLLAADLKDEAIGRQLGITRRSVQRRIRRLTELFGVSSRLQLLLQSARAGWV
jgi:predicted transcriptional regulator